MQRGVSRIVVLLAVSASAVFSQPVDFQRQVRPILSDKCFHCHGPDQSTRMVNLRLDTRQGVLEKRRTGLVVAPGKPQASLLWQRVDASQPARRMPPVSSHKSLSAEQKEILRRWIEQGAPWQEHWAFAAPERPAPPPVKSASWPRSPVDRFVLARLESAGLTPAPEASRYTLIRRATLDLTGLPPTPEEVRAFVADDSPDAYEKLVDRLLASPRYGEHRARYWLDAARYADTHGIHIDNYREMWAWRDWVIGAFNRNLPFDRFTIEQLAGDLLPNPTLDQRIATGFQRCNPTTNEAGAIEEEYEAIYAKDRVDTLGAVWLGLTIGCATCHDHKYDPLSQRDFYALTAFFRNTRQYVFDGNIADVLPTLTVPRDEDRDELIRLLGREAELRAALKAEAEKGFDAWLASRDPKPPSSPLPPSRELVSYTPAGNAAGPVELAHYDWFDGSRPFSVSVWFTLPKNDEGFTLAGQSDSKRKGLGWALGGRTPSFRLTRADGESLVYRAGFMQRLEPEKWYHLAATYDGRRDRHGLALYLDGKLMPRAGSNEDLVRLDESISTGEPLRIGPLEGGAIAGVRIYRDVLSPEEIELLARWPAIVKGDREALRLYYTANHNPEWRRHALELAAVRASLLDLRRRGSITHVMEERTDSKPVARLLYRGMYDQPRETLEPAVPAVLPPLGASQPRNRMGLALWLMDASNPLTARVTVNRFWQEVFGTGLVATSYDFGSQGEAASHPQLLDWLAVEFRESGWDMKKFFRLLVTSATYRQAALTTPEKLKLDPANRLLSRGPRFRMDAEMVRDYALAASGLLVPAIGGPSVKPYQPDGIWEAVAMHSSNTRFYQRDTGDKLYRRSLYTFWKRSAPPASMDIFNAPTRESCTVRRERTNTPLQALVTMNDVQFVEAARRLAEDAIQAEGLDSLAWRVLGRPLSRAETHIAARAFHDYWNYYKAHPDDARKLIAAGESKPDPALPPAQLAAYTMLANQLFNLDEVLTK